MLSDGKLSRRSGRKRIIMADGLAKAHAAGLGWDAILDALAKEHYWQGLIDEGRYRTVTGLAEGLGMDRSYVGRFLRLTLLAPEIVEGILRGAGAGGLSLTRLVKDVPMLWVEQRKMFAS